MYIVHVNGGADGIGGASIAALRLHRLFLQSGAKSSFACWDRPFAENAVLLRLSCLSRILRFAAHVILRVISGSNYSTGLIPSGMARLVNGLKPDVVILHWLQLDTMSMGEIAKLKAERVFWFHHDLWPIRGITAYAWYKTPPRLGWLDRLVKWNKRRAAKKMGKRLVPVCASKWVADEIRKSGMYAAEPLVIPLPLDGVFCRGRRNVSGKFRILNGTWGGFGSGLKGGDRLLAALKLIPPAEKEEMEMVVFGCDGEPTVKEGVQTVYAGILHGDDLARAYRDADVFAFPSRQETFGQTKLEALACGTPVIAFDETACAEGVEHRRTGWIAPADDIAGYAEGIRWFYHQWKDGRAVRVQDFDVVRHNAGVVAKWLSAAGQT